MFIHVVHSESSFSRTRHLPSECAGTSRSKRPQNAHHLRSRRRERPREPCLWPMFMPLIGFGCDNMSKNPIKTQSCCTMELWVDSLFSSGPKGKPQQSNDSSTWHMKAFCSQRRLTHPWRHRDIQPGAGGVPQRWGSRDGGSPKIIDWVHHTRACGAALPRRCAERSPA